MKKYIFLISIIFCLPAFAQSPVGAQNIEPQNVQPQSIQQSTQEPQSQEIEKPQQQEVSSQSNSSAPQAAVKEETEATTFSTIMGILLTLLVFVPPLLGSIKTRRHA